MRDALSKRARVRVLRCALAVALLALPVATPAPAPAAATITVRPGSTAGWTIVNRDAPTGSETADPTSRGTRTEFADGPAPAPKGLGSLRHVLGAADDSARLESFLLGGTRVADTGSLGYSTFVRQGRAGVATAMQLLIDLNGDGRFRLAEDDVLTFEPVHQHGGAPGAPVPNQCAGVSGCVAVGQWQRWDALAGGWWSLRAATYGPPLVTLGGYQTLYPAARIAADVPALRVSAGGAPAWEGFEGFIDAIAAGGADYDIESQVRIADCAAASDDLAVVQSAIDSAPPGFAIRLRGSCDFTQAEAHGGGAGSVDAAAVVVGSVAPGAGLTIESDGAPGSAAIVGSGTQTAFFVPPGARDITIRGLRFTNLARPIVVASAVRVTVGAAGPSLPNPAANSIAGGITMNSAVLAVATAGPVTVRYGFGGGKSVTYPAGADRLEDLLIAGNRIAYETAGVPDASKNLIAVDVRSAGGVADGIEIASNAIWFATNEFRSFDMNGVRVQGSVAAPATRVRIRGNSIGRPEEIGQAAPAIAAGGRVGILVHRATDAIVEANRVRAKISATPGADIPGGGIVVADVADTAVRDNAVIVLAANGTEPADLGALGIVDDLAVAFGGGAEPPATTRVTLTGNVVGTPGQGGIGAQRGIVVAGATWVEASENTIVFSSDAALSIGPEIRGPAAALPRAVATAVLCGNDLDGIPDDPNETTAWAAASSNFPGGSLLASNGECAPAGIAIVETNGDTTVAEAGGVDTYTIALTLRPAAPVTVSVGAAGDGAGGSGADATASPSSVTFTPDDWATPRTITVVGEQDTIPEGTHLQAITHTAVSDDAAYGGLGRTLLVFVLDDDPGSVLVVETGGSTDVAEGGGTDTYTVVLGSRPGADVRVVASAGTQLAVSPAVMVFTPGDWSVPRTVTVAAADDTLREGPHLATIAHRALSEDENFDAAPVPGIVVRIADNDAPAPPTITSPAAGSTIRVSSVVIAGKGEPGAGVSVTEGAAPVGSAVVSPSGGWAIGPIVFAEGSHTIVAVQTDPNGFASAPASRTFTVDLTPPEAPVIVEPSEGQVYLFAGIEVRGTAEPNSTVVITEGALTKSAPSDASGAWRAVILFAEGVHTIVATIYDGAGNPGPSSPPRTFTINADGIPPAAPSIISPEQDGIVAKRFTLTGTTEPLARVEVWEGSIPLQGGSAGSDGFFQVQLELESRTWLLRVRAIDQSFNVGPFATGRRVHVDGVLPTASVRKPLALPVVILPPGEEVTAFGAAADNFGVARVDVIYTNLNGAAITRQATLCCPDRGTVQWTDRATLAIGRYIVTAFSYDLAGNRSRGSSVDMIRL